MQVVRVEAVGQDYVYQWPAGQETFSWWVEYRARTTDRDHRVRVGFGTREVYGRERIRIVVWIDGNPSAEFFGADDFAESGEVLSEVRVPGERGERICRYPDEAVPERYLMFGPVGLPTRVRAQGVHNAWAVAASIADHHRMVVLAALRNLERVR
jgi:hypothetical protein